MMKTFYSADDRPFQALTLSFVRSAALTVLIIVLLCSGAFAQEIKVSGKITDREQIPLPGVLVTVKGTSVRVSSDANGRYNVDAPANAVLQFAFLGMETQELQVSNRTSIDVVLRESSIALEDVVVIGYGTQSRRTLTTAITKVGAEKIQDVPVTSITTALQGKLSGVRIYQGSGGQPGANASIIVRGGSSINKSNEPLTIVDGMVRSLDDISPNDIESVQVLKDASSTAIYGARASNGVVLVTTKRGAEDKAEITFNMNSGLASPWKYMDMVSGEDFITMTRTAAARSSRQNELLGQLPYGTGNDNNSPWTLRFLEAGESVPEGYLSMPDPLDASKTLIYQDNDFQRLTLNDAFEQNYNLAANGGTKAIRYAGSLGYSDIEGTSVGSDFSRFNGRANVDFMLRDNLTLTTRIDHSFSKTNNYPSAADLFNRSIWLVPVARLYLDDGSYAPGQNATFSSGLWYNDVHERTANVHRTGFGTSLSWNIMPGLEARVSGDYFIRNRTFESFEKANIFSSNRRSVFEYNQSRNMQLDGAVTYNKTISNSHNFNAVAGISQLYVDDLDANSEAQGASSDNIQTQNAGPLKLQANSSRSEELLLGVFGRLTYDYNQKYLLSLSLRRDVSSKFAKGYRTGYFPGISAGWIISEENFMNSVPVINTLKLRGSLGQTGNNAIGRYAYGGTYSVGNTYYGRAGSLSTAMPNPTLQWETTTQWDVGLDVGLFAGDRVSLLLDYFDKRTSNLLFNVPLPNESGYNNIDKNIGEVKFYGFEAELKAELVRNKNFKWSTDFNFGYNMNRVIKLPENGIDNNRIGGIYDPSTGQGVGGIAEGERMDAVLGYKSDFIIDTWEQANKARFDNSAAGWSPLDNKKVKGRKIPGDMEWVDLNNDGIIDNYDQGVLGYLSPTTTGGFGNNITYKNLELNVFVDYALGHSIADATIRRAYGNVVGGSYNLLSESLTETWAQEGDVASGKATMPRFDIQDNTQQVNYQRNHDRAVYKGDYLSLREVRLSYLAPQKVTSALHVRSLRISLSGQNLHYFTKYPGWATENSSQANYDDNTYPVARKLMVGIKLGL